MKSTNLTTNAPQGGSSCHAGKGGASNWLGGRRGLLLIAVAAIAGLALALNQHWLFAAQIVPLLFLLPCTVMMFMCMKGHGRQSNAEAASEKVETDSVDAR